MSDTNYWKDELLAIRERADRHCIPEVTEADTESSDSDSSCSDNDNQEYNALVGQCHVRTPPPAYRPTITRQDTTYSTGVKKDKHTQRDHARVIELAGGVCAWSLIISTVCACFVLLTID
jgi:hypothetical protein